MERTDRVRLSDGIYVLNYVLGEGSFARVWSVLKEDVWREIGETEALSSVGPVSGIVLDNSLAVKFFSPKLDEHKRLEDALLEKFNNEAGKMLAFNHPNIVRVYQHSPLETEFPPFYVLQQMSQSFARRMRSTQCRIEIPEIIDTLISVGNGLMHAYQNGVLAHGDLHPGNVLVGLSGEVKVADFGMALEFPPEPMCVGSQSYSFKTMGTDMVAERAILARTNFTAPELREGRLRDASERTDVYSMGVMLATALGSVPRNQDKEPLVEIVDRATRYIPSRRYESMAYLVAALNDARTEYL